MRKTFEVVWSHQCPRHWVLRYVCSCIRRTSCGKLPLLAPSAVNSASQFAVDRLGGVQLESALLGWLVTFPIQFPSPVRIPERNGSGILPQINGRPVATRIFGKSGKSGKGRLDCVV